MCLWVQFRLCLWCCESEMGRMCLRNTGKLLNLCSHKSEGHQEWSKNDLIRICVLSEIHKWEWTHNIFLAVWISEWDPWRMSLTMSQLSQHVSATTRQRCRALSISCVGLCSALPWMLNSCKGLLIALHGSGQMISVDNLEVLILPAFWHSA